ncbi:unnamed protein product [Auanema sp. JU1783]|nr:unnamed protein product [Auanema sp. JU1783]
MEQFIREWNWRSPMATQKTGSRRSRKRRNSDTSSDGAPPIRVLRSYGVDEKLEIIDFAKNNGNRAAGREYNVAESSIREWRKNEERLRQQAQQQTSPTVQKMMMASALRDIPKCDVSKVPLSLNISPNRRDSPSSADNQENEASLGAASSHSNHSGSPTLSLSGNDSNPIPIFGSGRRKARQPRKIICVEQ